MKTTAFVLLMCLVLLLSITDARASSAPAIFQISGTAYTVPTGKVLIIEQMNYTGGTMGTNSLVQVTLLAPSQLNLDIALGGQTMTKLPAPIRMAAGWEISAPSGPGTIICFGSIEDATDYVASANPVPVNTTIAGGQMSQLIDSRTCNVATTTGEASRDLSTWSTAGVSVGKSATNRRVTRVTTTADGTQKFLHGRLTVHATKQDDN